MVSAIGGFLLNVLNIRVRVYILRFTTILRCIDPCNNYELGPDISSRISLHVGSPENLLSIDFRFRRMHWEYPFAARCVEARRGKVPLLVVRVKQIPLLIVLLLEFLAKSELYKARKFIQNAARQRNSNLTRVGTSPTCPV